MTQTILPIDPEWGVADDPAHFADAWHALTHRTALADRSARLRLAFTGEKAAEALTGLVTSDVLALTPGTGQYAAALTPKGKILTDLRILCRADDLLLDVPAAAGAAFQGMLRKYVNPRLARATDVSSAVRVLGAYGPSAAGVVARTLEVGATELEAMPDWSHVGARFEGAPVTVVRVPDVGVAGFECLVTADAVESLHRALVDEGAAAGTAGAFEAARILAGRPRWGQDMDDTTLTQEALLDDMGAVSYTKGCYTGQEVVARLHFRGHVNRLLRGLSAEGELVPGARLETMDGREVGDVRSTAPIPGLGTVALAMVRREVELGSTATARWEGRASACRVVPLPFPSA